MNSNQKMRTALIGGLMVAMLGWTFQSAAHSIVPGLWKATSSVRLNGIPLPSSDSEECISKKDAKDLKTTISEDLKEKGCQLTEWSIKKQKLSAGLTCKNDDIDAKGQLQGHVTTKSYDLTGDAKGSFKGIPASVEVKFAGNWVSACGKGT